MTPTKTPTKTHLTRKDFQSLFQQFYGEYEENNTLNQGKFRLLSNPLFCADFLSFIAKNSQKFQTLEQWQRFINTHFKPPKKPVRENPFLYKNPKYIGRDDIEARTYREYIFSHKMEEYHQEADKIQQQSAEQHTIKTHYGNDEKGYCLFICDQLSEEEQQFLDRYQPFIFSEKQRLQHTYISGGTGSGKSEMMKNLIHHYLTKDTNTALVLIDPHGKIAQEVAQFKENASTERLMFIAPDFDPQYTPVFNPFDTEDSKDPISLDIAVQELVSAFREILQDIGFTPQMETLLKPCIATIFLYPEGNLYHLQQMMDEEEGRELLAFALKNLPNPAQRNFLKTDFLKSSYTLSKQSIRTKIQSLLNSQIFLNFLIGKSSFSLTEAINQKKLIIFSLSRNSGAETSDTMGRLILAHLQSIAMQRTRLSSTELRKAPPIHLFIDECQHYITPSIEIILTETRKYKLYLTLANQFLGQIKNRRIRNAIKGNTALKITGKQTEPETLASIAKITNTPSEAILNLKTGQYFVKLSHKKSLKIEGSTHLLNDKNAMNKTQWHKFKKQKITTYYLAVKNTKKIYFEVNKKSYPLMKKPKKRKLN